MTTQKPLLSIIIPALNEGKNVLPLYERLQKNLSPEPLDFEIVFVDDGSSDDTALQVQTLHDKDTRVKLISLSRNFGHQIALTAGLDHAQGDAVIMMDADLQHPPEILHELLQKWREGYEIVYTVRESTLDAGWLKKITAKIYYRIFQRLTRIDMPTHAADFRLLDRQVVQAFSQIRERTRFLRGLTSWVGFRSIGISYHAGPRLAGSSSYSPRRMINLAVNGLVSFSATPLYFATYLGFFISGMGFIYLLYVLYIHFIRRIAVPGWSSTVMSVTIIGGFQLILMGVIGTYIARIYEEVKQRPIYLVRRSMGFENKKSLAQRDS